MDRYVTSTELKQNLKRVKEYARMGLVHVLDNGQAGYVLCSTEIYEDLVHSTRGQAAWRAEACEVVREMEYDRMNQRLIPLGDVVPLGRYAHEARTALRMQITQTAAKDIVREYAGDSMDELAYMMTRVADDPTFGISVELQDKSSNLRKVLVSPYDVLYVWDEAAGCVLVAGIVNAP